MSSRKTYSILIYHMAKYRICRSLALNHLGLLTADYVIRILIRLYRPKSFLEIGVGRGKTFAKFLYESSRLGLSKVKYYGFDTFDEGPPSDETDLLEARIARAKVGDKFWEMHHTPMDAIYAIGDQFPKVECEVKLYKGNTKDILPVVIPQLSPVDFIYIDGGHSYDTVKSDYLNIKPLLRANSLIVFDDFNCAEGVSKFVGELLCEEGGFFSKILFLPGTFTTWQCATVVLIYKEEETPRLGTL